MEVLDTSLRLHPSGGWTGGMIRLIGSGADGKFRQRTRDVTRLFPSGGKSMRVCRVLESC